MANEPCRQVVNRITARVSALAGVNPSDVCMAMYDRKLVAIRDEVFRQVLAETGCTMMGLARVWGCHYRAIQRAVAKPSLVFEEAA